MTAGLLLSGCAALGGGSAQEREQARSLYAEALEAVERGDLEAAQGMLDELQEAYPETRHARQALLEAAYVEYRLGQYPQAIERAEIFHRQAAQTEEQADDEDLRYALYLRAAAAHALWDATEGEAERDAAGARRAFGYYRDIVRDYPESERAEEAARRMNEIRSDVAEEELRRARRRLDDGAYAEAAERGAWIAEQYPGQQAAADALALQVDALERLGREREAEATRRMLEIKHPDHPALR
ncbi:outer membrane protein assembly factor BamD [Halorhodospira halophila]|uniref:outer membrane protein assembly factor BamD n=1 Tax=Halorhodospira halophila TaxID=1053 RepID=UPI00164FD884|nr:outer membrane protein assembly factor BamD [Halorhodospira halophila]